ncbi:MAG TPA: hypothetical protein VFD58_04370 [Blastocatellia bacterium]|nr:hypothetical protein [Blastocatellia bacterium]
MAFRKETVEPLPTGWQPDQRFRDCTGQIVAGHRILELAGVVSFPGGQKKYVWTLQCRCGVFIEIPGRVTSDSHCASTSGAGVLSLR